MKRRSLKWLVLLAGLGLTGFSLYLWLAPGGGINRLSVLRIKTGMTHDEVDAVIGLPPGDHRSTPHGFRASGIGNARNWHGDAGTITVWFDDDGKVTERQFSPSDPSFFDKVYQWMGIDLNVPRIPELPLPPKPFFEVDDQP